jgi:hypothetical protein
LIDRLDEAEGRIKGLLLDTTNIAAAAALSTMKYHDPSFDLQTVLEVKASRPLIRILVINDNHYGLTFLFEL